MIEIDGELFEDPCETIRIEKQIAALFVAQSAIVQIRAIQVQPLFPPRAEGGEIVSLPDRMAGDILDAEFGKEMIIGVDHGIKGGDICIK